MTKIKSIKMPRWSQRGRAPSLGFAILQPNACTRRTLGGCSRGRHTCEKARRPMNGPQSDLSGRAVVSMHHGHLANLSSAPRQRWRTPAKIAGTTGERLVDHIAAGRFCLHAPKGC
jgi:hypothetical protein